MLNHERLNWENYAFGDNFGLYAQTKGDRNEEETLLRSSRVHGGCRMVGGSARPGRGVPGGRRTGLIKPVNRTPNAKSPRPRRSAGRPRRDDAAVWADYITAGRRRATAAYPSCMSPPEPVGTSPDTIAPDAPKAYHLPSMLRHVDRAIAPDSSSQYHLPPSSSHPVRIAPDASR